MGTGRILAILHEADTASHIEKSVWGRIAFPRARGVINYLLVGKDHAAVFSVANTCESRSWFVCACMRVHVRASVCLCANPRMF